MKKFDYDIVIIGEGITSLSLACAMEMTYGPGTKVICPTECDDGILRSKDCMLRSEEEIENILSSAKIVIADPLYQPICPDGTKFISLPAEAFSGRIYRQQIPNLITNFEDFAKEVL